MVRQRVKTDDEYDRLLEINDSKRDTDVIVNDASKHFQQLKSTRKDKENPFESNYSIQDIKKNLYKEKHSEVDEIKKDIELGQADKFSTDTITSEQIVQKHQDLTHRIRSNTNRLYDNLREPRFTPTKKASRVERNSAKISPEIIELEPMENKKSSIVVDVTPESSVGNTYQTDLNQQFEQIATTKENQDSNGLDLTVDFTKENTDFLEKINQARQVVEHKIEFNDFNSNDKTDVSYQTEDFNDTKPLDFLQSSKISNNTDVQSNKMQEVPVIKSIEDQLNDQMASLGYDNNNVETKVDTDNQDIDYTVEESLQYQPDIMEMNHSQLQPDIMEMNQSQVQPDIMEMNQSQVQPDIMEMNQSQVQPDIMETNQSQLQPDIMEMNQSQVQPEIMATTNNQVDGNNELNRKINLQNTLKLALDANDEHTLSDSQLNILESNVLKDDIKAAKTRKSSDIILTVILIIMIIVVLFLILRLILSGE